MWSQVETIYVYLRDPDAPEGAADAEVAKLLNDFTQQSTISKEVRQVAKEFAKQGKPEKSAQLHEYNVETYPADANAVWSQVDVFEMLVDGNDLTAEDWAAADAAVAKLLTRFAGNPELASAVRKAGDIYNARGRPDKAMDLWTTNVESAPDSVDAMVSQMNIIYTAIDNNDVDDATIDAEVEKLLTTFAKQPSLPQRVHEMAGRYRDKKNHERAIHFYNLVNQKWPKSDSAFWATFETGKIKIELADHDGAQVVMDNMIADFKDHPELANRLACLGDEYFYDKNYPRAIDIWKMVLNDYPGQGPTMIAYLLGTAHERLKDYPTAAKYYEQSAAEYPKCKYAWRVPFSLGYVYKQLGNNERALYWFGQQGVLYSKESTMRLALMEQANIYLFRIKDYVKAAEKFQEYIETYQGREEHAEAHLNLAVCIEKMGHVTVAIEILEQALEIHPDSIYANQIRNKIEKLREAE